MRKIFLTAVLMLSALSINAQLATVQSVQRVDVGVVIDKPVISADGSFVVAQAGANGIVKIDADGTYSTVADAPGAYHLRLTADGQNIVFANPEYNNKHMRYVSLQSVNIATKNVSTLVKATRRLNSGVGIVGNSVTAVENGKCKVRSLDGTKAVRTAVASINYGHLDITVDGKTRTIDPQGRGSYIWPSISPDGTKVVYWCVGAGCFVCDLDGSNVQRVGALRAAVWAGNDRLVGMDEVEGFNQQVTASSLRLYDLTSGVSQTLTDESVKAQFPSASADGSRIAFTTPEGELYILTLTK